MNTHSSRNIAKNVGNERGLSLDAAVPSHVLNRDGQYGLECALLDDGGFYRFFPYSDVVQTLCEFCVRNGFSCRQWQSRTHRRATYQNRFQKRRHRSSVCSTSTFAICQRFLYYLPCCDGPFSSLGGANSDGFLRGELNFHLLHRRVRN